MLTALWLAAALSTARAEECADPATLVASAERDVVRYFLAEAEKELADAVRAYSCSGLADPDDLSRLWLAEGAILTLMGHEDRARRSWAAAQRVAREHYWNEDYGDEIRARYESVAPPAGPTGTLVLKGLPTGSAAAVDGRVVQVPAEVEAGLHLVQAGDLPGTASFARVVLVQPGADLVVAVDAPRVQAGGDVGTARVTGTADYRARIEALMKARAEREEAERRAEEARQHFEEEMRAAEELRSREATLAREIAGQRAEEVESAKAEVRAEAAESWQMTVPLLDDGGPQARAAIRAFLDTYGEARVVLDDYEEAVEIPEVAMAREWLRDHRDQPAMPEAPRERSGARVPLLAGAGVAAVATGGLVAGAIYYDNEATQACNDARSQGLQCDASRDVGDALDIRDRLVIASGVAGAATLGLGTAGLLVRGRW